jgi:hypothetical protein
VVHETARHSEESQEREAGSCRGKLILADATKAAIKALSVFEYIKVKATPTPRSEYPHRQRCSGPGYRQKIIDRRKDCVERPGEHRSREWSCAPGC